MIHFNEDCCILLKFYIKPQLIPAQNEVPLVVSY